MTPASRRRPCGRGRVLAFLELLLILVGAACIGWYGGVRVAAAREQAVMSHELEIAQRALPAVIIPGAPHVQPRSVVARIAVPRLKLSAVAREGIDAGTLAVAIGHVPGTALPGETGNAAFAAHRDTFFRPLRGAHEGDLVIVTTPRGTYRYRITGSEVVAPDDVSVLGQTAEPTLTLVTCYPFNYVGRAPYRFIVRAELLPS